MDKFYTYIVECSDGTYYTGWTVNLENRIKAHNNGTGAKYTKTRTPVSLIYFEVLESKSLAMKREASIKKLSKKKKELLISSFSTIY